MAEAAPAAPPAAQYKVKYQEIPKFDGGKSLPVKYWCSCVDACVPIVGNTAEGLRQVAQLAKDACTADARTFVHTLALTQPAGYDTWNVDVTVDSLKKLIHQRFFDPSVQDITKIKEDCVQTAGEDVAAFYDRCTVAAWTIAEINMPERGAVGNNNPHRLNDDQWRIYSAAWRDEILGDLFLRGLLPNIKAHTMEREGTLRNSR